MSDLRQLLLKAHGQASAFRLVETAPPSPNCVDWHAEARACKETGLQIETTLTQALAEEKYLDSQFRATFITGFSFALEALIHETGADFGWSASDRRYPETLRDQGRIPSTCRMFLDRFAKFFQDCRLPGEMYEPLKALVFEPAQDKTT